VNAALVVLTVGLEEAIGVGAPVGTLDGAMVGGIEGLSVGLIVGSFVSKAAQLNSRAFTQKGVNWSNCCRFSNTEANSHKSPALFST